MRGPQEMSQISVQALKQQATISHYDRNHGERLSTLPLLQRAILEGRGDFPLQWNRRVVGEQILPEMCLANTTPHPGTVHPQLKVKNK